MNRRLLLLPLLGALAACGSDRDFPSPETKKQAPSIGAPLPLDTSGLPRFRAGLWEVVSRRGAETETERVCQAAGVEPKLHEFLAAPAEPGCRKTRSRAGGQLRTSMRCVGPGSTLDMSVGLAGSDTRYSLTMITAVTGADGSRADETISAEARWISACPTGAAPGDVFDQDGV